MSNYIVGVMGKKGSGKSFAVKYVLKRIPRYIILDSLHEYERGIIFHNANEVREYIKRYSSIDFKIIYRPTNDEDVFQFLNIISHVNNYTFIAEEIDLYCNSYAIDPNILYNIKYGRHFNRNLIWITRAPFEINRFLTRNSDVIITFRQTEPRDLDYLKKYSFNVTKEELMNLPEYKYAVHLDNPQGEQVLSYFDRSGMFLSSDPQDDSEQEYTEIEDEKIEKDEEI